MSYTWTDPTAHVYATGEVVTAATMNTYVQQNLAVLGQTRSASLATGQSTTSTTYTDLTTAGPSITATTMTSGFIVIGAALTNSQVGGGAFMSFAISGATTQAAADVNTVRNDVAGAGSFLQMSALIPITGMTAGSSTFTAKYRALSGTATFANRSIAWIPGTS